MKTFKVGQIVRVKKHGWIMIIVAIEENMIFLENLKYGGNVGSYFIDDLEAVKRQQMTLSELSGILIQKGFADIFDGDVESDCLDIANMKGSWADREGNEIIYFDIIKIDNKYDHLETIIEVEEV